MYFILILLFIYCREVFLEILKVNNGYVLVCKFFFWCYIYLWGEVYIRGKMKCNVNLIIIWIFMIYYIIYYNCIVIII